MREFHFYGAERYVPKGIIPINGYLEAVEEIDRLMAMPDDTEFVMHTTQIAAMTHAWDIVFSVSNRSKGYRNAIIVIHDAKGPFTVAPEEYGGCERTDQALRPAHNIFRMYISGAFEEEAE